MNINAQETKALANVMLAWTDGIKVQFRKKGSAEWRDIPHHNTIAWNERPSWDWRECEYRIAPEPEKAEVLRAYVYKHIDGTLSVVGRSLAATSPWKLIKTVEIEL